MFSLFQSLYPNRKCDLIAFCVRTGCLGVKSKRGRKDKYYYAVPISDLANKRHHTDRNHVNDQGVDFHLVNIEGLITQKYNKVEILDKYAELTKGKKILAITETHLMKDQHMDPEALKYIPGFKIYRTDRDVNHDEDALSKWGGTLILASPDVISNKSE